MPLESVPNMLQRARDGGYAIGYFESWNLESLQGVLDAAESTRSPVVIGFNGQFLASPARLAAERLVLYGALGRAAAEAASVPCGLIFNECPESEWTRRAVSAGFNLVMPSAEGVPAADYLAEVTELTALAHGQGVAVEAELGELPCATSANPDEGSLTDPDEAAAFVTATGVDLLAVSVGNVHVQLEGEKGLDVALTSHLARRLLGVALVLHGGSGIAPDALQGAIAAGVTKVNFGTYLKQRYLDAARRVLAVEHADPHDVLGRGGDADVMTAARLAVRDAVLERLPLLGCQGKG